MKVISFVYDDIEGFKVQRLVCYHSWWYLVQNFISSQLLPYRHLMIQIRVKNPPSVIFMKIGLCHYLPCCILSKSKMVDFQPDHFVWDRPRIYSSCSLISFHIILFQQYIRVMAQNAQCSEDGPFFPTTPRYIIQNGMSIEQDILQSPDWILIAIMCVAVLLTVIIIIIALVS